MVDQIYDRGYQAARTELNSLVINGLTRAAKAALNAFAVLNRIEYDSPWTRNSKAVRSH